MRNSAKERERQDKNRQPFNWPNWDDLAKLDSQNIDAFDLEDLSKAAKVAYRQLSEQDDAALLAKSIRQFDEKLLQYQSAKLAALLNWLEDADHPEKAARFHAFVLEEAELESLINTVYRPLLEKEQLTELAEFLGKNLFMRIQNRQILYKPELTELLQTEKLLMAQGPEQPGLFSAVQLSERRLAAREDAEAEDEADEAPVNVPLLGFAEENRKRQAGKSLHEIYLQLFTLRLKLADELRLPNFKDLALLRQERFEYSPTKLLHTVALIQRFFVPLAMTLRRDLHEEGELNRAEQFLCWQNWLPKSKTLPSIEAAKTDLDFVTAFLALVMKGIAPNFLTRLQEKSFVRLQLGGDKAWADCVLLPEADLPCLLGQINLTAAELPQLLEVLGLAYAYLCSYKDGSFAIMREPSGELKKIWSYGLLFLSVDLFPQLFEEEEDGRRYQALFLEHTIQRLCYQAMLFEFENEIADLARPDREAMERSWSRVIRRYFPDLAEDSAWLRMQRGAFMYLPQLWLSPFASVVELQALLVGLGLWDQSRADRSESLTAYETLCTLGSSDSVPHLLEQARLADPWSEDSVKRLAYQLAYHLGY